MPAPVLVVMAMEAEAQPVLAALGGSTPIPVPPRWGPVPHRWFEAQAGQVVVAVNGPDPIHGVDSIGTVPAALTTYAAALEFEPSVIISAGTAGGWHRLGAEIGDVYLGSRVRFHDRRIPLAGFEAYGATDHHAPALPPALERRVSAGEFKVGVVTTGDSLDMSPTDEAVIAANDGAVKEMEAAAVARIGQLLGIDVIAVKAITDLVDDPVGTPAQFVENLGRATARLAEAMVPVVAAFAEATGQAH